MESTAFNRDAFFLAAWSTLHSIMLHKIHCIPSGCFGPCCIQCDRQSSCGRGGIETNNPVSPAHPSLSAGQLPPWPLVPRGVPRMSNQSQEAKTPSLQGCDV